MKFSSFNYTKKNGENNNYFILKTEENEDYVHGIVLNKLETEEIEDLMAKYFKYEVKQKEIEESAKSEGQTIEDYLAANQDVKEEYDSYYETIKPYIKKAYRKFIADKIQKLVLSEDGVEDLKEQVDADLSDNKK